MLLHEHHVQCEMSKLISEEYKNKSTEVARTTEKELPFDKLFFDNESQKIYGIQYKGNYKNRSDELYVKLDNEQLNNIQNKSNKWIYYGITAAQSAREINKDNSIFINSNNLNAGVNTLKDIGNKNFLKTDELINEVRKCNIGLLLKTAEDYKRISDSIINNLTDNQKTDLLDGLSLILDDISSNEVYDLTLKDIYNLKNNAEKKLKKDRVNKQNYNPFGNGPS